MADAVVYGFESIVTCKPLSGRYVARGRDNRFRTSKQPMMSEVQHAQRPPRQRLSPNALRSIAYPITRRLPRRSLRPPGTRQRRGSCCLAVPKSPSSQWRHCSLEYDSVQPMPPNVARKVFMPRLGLR